MGVLSILPAHLSSIETWAARFFLILALITFGPWILVLVYDFLLYVWRWATYELPVVGGRARGRRRPRAPTLTERPDGHPRHFNLPSTGVSLTDDENSTSSAPKSTSRKTASRLPFEHDHGPK